MPESITIFGRLERMVSLPVGLSGSSGGCCVLCNFPPSLRGEKVSPWEANDATESFVSEPVFTVTARIVPAGRWSFCTCDGPG